MSAYDTRQDGAGRDGDGHGRGAADLADLEAREEDFVVDGPPADGDGHDGDGHDGDGHRPEAYPLPTGDLDALLEHLRDERGFDLTGYKRATLERRIARRTAAVGVSTYEDYRDVLEVRADEWTALLDTVLINLTSFFRDEEAWEELRTVHLPRLLRGGGRVRAWSAGCATGQEAYTLAIVLCELLGPEAYRERVKIYATDVDESALAAARSGAYSARETASLPADLRERYFEAVGERLVFRRDLRRAVIFGRNDLVQDAPISHVDVLLCRNTLMYLTQETQARVAQRLHFSLEDRGVLMLGRAETLLSQGALFTPVDLGNRLFGRAGHVPPRADARGGGTWAEVGPDAALRAPAALVLREQAVLTAPAAQVVLDAAGALAVANHRAGELFGLGAEDVGSPFQDLVVSYRPVGLRSAVDEARASGAPVWVRDVAWHHDGEDRVFDVSVTPLVGAEHRVVGTSIVFTDTTRERALALEFERASERLRTAHEELQSTHEELETTNEELQSTVEELETTNEELQSTNEELETMNEELQSMNEELHSTNEDLRVTGDEVAGHGDVALATLAALRSAVVVLDPPSPTPPGASGAPQRRVRAGRVRVWNAASTELWGVRADEAVGTDLADLDVGLPAEPVAAAAAAVLADGAHRDLVLDAVERHGRAVAVAVRVSALVDEQGRTAGAVVAAYLVEGSPAQRPDALRPRGG